jgi:glutathione peroxidase
MPTTLFDISVKTSDGKERVLSDYGGQVLLIVNVASYCGYTPQYKGLEQLNHKYGKEGLKVLGFPCNDFGAQEPGSLEEIIQFCDRSYSISFELFDKIHAKGSQQHPLYTYLTRTVQPTGDVSWNFEKFLVNKKGEVVGRFKSSVAPDAPELVRAIERELAQ